MEMILDSPDLAGVGRTLESLGSREPSGLCSVFVNPLPCESVSRLWKLTCVELEILEHLC